MLVSFRQPTAGQSPETLRQLQVRTNTCVSYLSSVSSSLHVYAFSGYSSVETLRMNLRSWPAVLDAEPDQKARAQPSR
jgi:hypothetical protein